MRDALGSITPAEGKRCQGKYEPAVCLKRHRDLFLSTATHWQSHAFLLVQILTGKKTGEYESKSITYLQHDKATVAGCLSIICPRRFFSRYQACYYGVCRQEGPVEHGLNQRIP
ncbi:MAG: hypothetical protein C0613_10350 [Desulfobulbaceae bacterium]|nr:MAG: hypothetical protein C0613_10350 [Desulfobulbaceae bacterium]